MDLRVRNARPEDLAAVMEVEEHWPPDQRAGRRKMEVRLERFPAGFFLCELEGALIGFSTSGPVRYDPGDLSEFQTWKHACNDGYLHPPEEVREVNALYIASTCVVEPRRGQGVLEALIDAQIGRTRELGFAYAVTGATIPGYDAHCQRHGEISAAHYALARKDGLPIDGFLRKLELLGLRLPDERHVIPGYYPSPESRDHAALLVYRAGVERPVPAPGRR